MKKTIGIASVVGLAAFVWWWPLGFAYAVLTGVCATLLGSWMLGSGAALGLLNLVASLAMGFLTVLSVCIGLAPGVGTFVFATSTTSTVLTLRAYGAGQAEFSLWTLPLLALPTIAGAMLGYWVRKEVAKEEASPAAVTKPV